MYTQIAESVVKDLSSHISPELDDGKLTENLGKVIHYLSAYGYIQKDRPTLIDVVSGVVKLKQFFTLQSESLIDSKLLGLVNTPRCCVPDFMRTEASRWRKNKLTYYIARRDTDLSADIWDSEIQEAWKAWTEVADLTVTRVNNTNADIIIDIGQGQRDNFDGPSGTLAWAYLPNGRDTQLLMKFDVSETWIHHSGRGIILRNVATHEFGHLLGLEHSRAQSALMAPYYSPAVAKPQANDDIPRIQNLYGKAKDSVPTDPVEPQNPTIPTSDDEIIIKLKGSVIIPGYKLTKIQK